MKATWKGAIIAESDETIVIEGNHYFPQSSVNMEFLEKNEFVTVCPWKGESSYYNIIVDGETNENGAWYYHKPKETAFKVVGKDFSDYVAFWNGVEVTE